MIYKLLRESKSRLSSYHRGLLSGKSRFSREYSARIKTVLALLVCLFFLLNGCSSELPTETQVTFSPQHPGWNEKITVSFTPGADSPLAQADKVVMQALSVPDNPLGNFYKKGKMKEIPMRRKGLGWTAKIAADENTGCIIFQFEADDKFENNDKNGWALLLYSETGKPVRGAYSALSNIKGLGFLTYLMDLEATKIDTALALYEKEIELYPGNWQARTAGLTLRTRKAKNDKNENELAKIGNELDSLLSEHPNDVNLLNMMYYHYYRSNPEKSAQVLEQIKKLEPQHITVLSKKLSKIRKIKDTEQRIEKLRALEQGICDTDAFSWWFNYILQELSALEQWESIVEIANKHLEKLGTDESSYPAFTKKKKEQFREGNLFRPMQKLATAYHKLGNNNKAEEYYKKLSKFVENLSSSVRFTLWENYLQFLVDTEQWDKAAAIGQTAIEEAESNDKIVELFKTAYTKKTGDTEAAEQAVAEAKKKAGTFREEEIAKTFMADAQPAAEFTLKNLDSEDVSLASFRGKNVIVDFWATWCGPCIKSFPYLQKFWEQHQNNPDVMVFAVNCSEQKKGGERIKLVKKFMADNNYTFPVLFDNPDDGTKTAYGVSGIPTKFFVGPDGKIYFKEVGFHGPGMTDDMNIQLEMIRERVKVTN